MFSAYKATGSQSKLEDSSLKIIFKLGDRWASIVHCTVARVHWTVARLHDCQTCKTEADGVRVHQDDAPLWRSSVWFAHLRSRCIVYSPRSTAYTAGCTCTQPRRVQNTLHEVQRTGCTAQSTAGSGAQISTGSALLPPSRSCLHRCAPDKPASLGFTSEAHHAPPCQLLDTPSFRKLTDHLQSMSNGPIQGRLWEIMLSRAYKAINHESYFLNCKWFACWLDCWWKIYKTEWWNG